MDDDELDRLLGRATRHAASERLRAAVRTQVALQAAAQAQPPNAQLPRAAAARRPAWLVASLGGMAGVAAGVLAAVMLTSVVPAWQAARSLPADVVASHTRVLASGALFDVASGDRHNVKPWFQGRIDFAPQVPDLAAQGFALRGGRVDHLRGHAVAALVYAHRQHVVQVYEWADEARSAPQAAQQRGYNLLHWGDGAMQVWVVSDADAGELERFGQRWRSAVAEQAAPNSTDVPIMPGAPITPITPIEPAAQTPATPPSPPTPR